VPDSPDADTTDPGPLPPAVLSLEMLPLPSGRFRMGTSGFTDAGIALYAKDWYEAQARPWVEREQPAHDVRLSSFLIARTPLTRGQWRAVMREAPDAWARDASDDDLPATDVSWVDAVDFCNALSVRDGLAPCYVRDAQGQWTWQRTADGWRLPTEAEWEYACRAGTQSAWFWGEDPAGADAYTWYTANSGYELKPVGQKRPNDFGLYDMAGLVFEWCWDWFETYSADGAAPPLDPAGPGGGSQRVARGGSFGVPPDGLRCAYRGADEPEFRSVDLGLRCVRSGARQP
jgi:formylglycine-generating enzyme required for sulfatase activity